MTAAADRRLVTGLRLRAQLIASAEPRGAVAVVRHLLAAQAQDYASVLWSIALRSGVPDSDAVTAAIERGELVRSWPMRGTLFLVEPTELGWLLDLTADRTIRGSAGVYRDRGLDDATFARARDLVERLLPGRAATRAELFAAFADAGIDPSGQRGIQIIAHLAMRQVLVVGPHEGRQPTYALFAERVVAPRRLDRDEALGELAARYVRSHGPATIRDLAWWSQLTLTDARRGLELARPHLVRREIGDVEFWLDPAVDDAGPAAPGIHLLPGFDEFVLGYRDRAHAIAPEHAERIVPGGNGVFMPTIVVDGRVVGTWRRTATRDRVDIEPVPFAPLSARAAHGVERAARLYGRHLGLEPRVAAASLSG